MNSEKLIEPQFLTLIANEIGCLPRQIIAADVLLSQGCTVPFIARYRKEATSDLDDEKLENIAKQREYYLELAERRDAILESISSQGKLTQDLETAIRAAVSKQQLEDLYLPYKPKRRTRAQIAKEKGLEPLASEILAKSKTDVDPLELAKPFVDPEKGVNDTTEALAGARDILAEQLSESAENRASLRNTMSKTGVFESHVLMGQEEAGADYRDYFEFSQLATDIPSHRMLAILRGEREGFLISSLRIDDDHEIKRLGCTWGVDIETPCGQQISESTSDGYKRLLKPSISNEVRAELQEKAEAEAISVFRANLTALLMQAPLGQKAVMGLDPGYRTGCKLALVDHTGRVLETSVIYPVPPNEKLVESAKVILQNINKHNVGAIAIGNGTASRETEYFVKNLVKESNLTNVIVIIVPETGASVYSASSVARDEFPDLDVSLRGAVSIARRLQDPLAELVKIDPKSLGVGQYQHDVNQKALEKELDIAVEAVVNNVGVELNTASAQLLRRVSGLSERIAKAIVKYRDEKGSFVSRKSLLDIRGLGPKTFEQSAGFLRIRNSENPLDSTAVHPERYPVVEQMASELKVSINDLIGRPDLVEQLKLDNYIDESKGIGSYTLKDIRDELMRPGRDPRPNFEVPHWRDEIRSIEDLKEGMVLEGRVSNVANFGAFVDIGIKQDGLIHLSELSNQWIDDPRKVVQVGKIVKVAVKEIDLKRNRVALSMKALQPQGQGTMTKSNMPKQKQRKAQQTLTLDDLKQKFARM